jgi:diguanylate cyclase (GGDEF)-like protein
LKKQYFIASLILISVLFILYATAIFCGSNFWSDFLSAINALVASFFLLLTFLKSRRDHFVYFSWLLFSCACLFWGVADALWLIDDLLIHLNPADVAIIPFFYMLTNVFFAAGLILFALYQFRTWNIAKLLLDTVVFSYASILLAWILFFNRSNEVLHFLTFEGFTSFVSIIIDLMIYVGIVVWYLSIRNGRIPLYARLISGGIFFYILCDLYYYYVSYNNLYLVNSIIDILYLSSLLLVAAGGILEMYRNETILLESNLFYSNVGRRSKDVLILLCPVLIFFTRGFVLSEVLMFIALFIIYVGLNAYFQAAINNEALLKKELELNHELETIVADRTQKLLDANAKLHEKNRELHQLSSTDTLTKLYNRRYFLEDLEKNIATLKADETIALFYLDLDRFKLINDTYGHQMGDAVLVEISNRLTQTNHERATVARMGGDEFVFTIAGLADRVAAIDLAKAIISTCSREIHIGDYVFYPALCIGISIYPHDAPTAEALIKHADLSLYHAKSRGINKFSMYNALLREKSQRRNEIELFLRKSNFFDNLRLYYQPQFSIPDEKLIGVEALIRWISEDNKIMTPAEFIQVAEETDRINEIGLWVMQEAITQITRWNATYNQELRMGINISPKQLGSTELMKELKKLSLNNHFNPNWLDIEITENIAMDSELRFSQVFNLFKSFGFSVSIDDFGTGYSSISYFKNYHFDRIKIAKPLIDSIVSSLTSKQIVRAIILLAKTIGIRTIAEGVESRDQLKVLNELDCDQIQGFVLGKPMPAGKFEALFLQRLSQDQLI